MNLKLLWQKANETEIFNYILILSLSIHVSTIAVLSLTHAARIKKSSRSFEVSYEMTEIPQATKAAPVQSKSVKPDRPRQAVKEKLAKTSLPSSFIKDSKKINADIASSQKQPSSLDSAYTRPKVSIPVFKSEKMTDPQFISYENKIRTKIRNRAYILLEQLMTAEDFEAGEVYLTFLIGVDGSLREIKIIEEKTSANSFLRRIALMSVKESNPFSPLPDNKYPEITYNITISFEIGKGAQE